MVNIYAPNWDDVGFMQRVVSQFPDLDTDLLILGGDFNCVMDPNLNRSNPKAQTLVGFQNFSTMQHVWIHGDISIPIVRLFLCFQMCTIPILGLIIFLLTEDF